MATERDFEGLETIAKECWQIAQSKGWHQDEKFREQILLARERLIEAANGDRPPIPPEVEAVIVELDRRTSLANGVNLPEQIMLIVTEAAEAMESYRQSNLDPKKCYMTSDQGLVEYDDTLEPARKPEGFGSEMIDILIRNLHICKRVGIDIVAEYRRKTRYNLTRSHRHGNKRA